MKWRVIVLSSILILGVLTGALHYGSEKAKGTYVSGTISSSTTWDLAGSPYIVVGDITIEWAVTLTIEPGVQVLFDGYYSITGTGFLTAIGTPSKRISFSSNNIEPNPVYWHGIDVGNLRYASISYSDMFYAHNALFGNSVTDFESHHNNISNNIAGINIQCGGDPMVHIWNNYFSFNNHGVYLSDCHPSPHMVGISSNNFVSSGKGVEISGSEIMVYWNNFIMSGAIDHGSNNHWNWHPGDGNYWSYYDEESEGCFDLDPTDGICDEPFSLGLFGADVWPQTNPFSIPIPPDTSGPIIRDIKPPHGSVTNQTKPTIMANYSDTSGVNASNVLLKIDNIDVTSLANFTEKNVTYTPESDFSEGLHIVHLRIRDIKGNLAQKTWSFSVDTTSPSIINLEPLNNSIVGNNSTNIGANYSDASSINTSSVLLKVDDVDVTSLATVTSTGVNITMQLDDGLHNVSLEVRDILRHFARVNWSFTVDTSIPDTFPPIIANLQPVNSSKLIDNKPIISAEYDDPSGIDMNSILLKVDDIDVTLSATVASQEIIYAPGTALSDGFHQVYLEVRDSPGNLALRTWSFTIDASPPSITNLKPVNSSIVTINTPSLGANYSDSSGINVSSVLLKVDDTDVTALATVTPSGVKLITSMTDGLHKVSLEVGDLLGNFATANWSFTIDTSIPDTFPPTITDLQPVNSSILNYNSPSIGANYSDPSEIDISSVLLKVDDIDVTSLASITFLGISYVPGTALSDGVHNAYLEVQDTFGNLATVMWFFTVETNIIIDSTPPAILDLKPSENSIITNTNPDIIAGYHDSSGIDINGVILRIDGINVTKNALVFSSNVRYSVISPLSDGNHKVSLEVRDVYGNLAATSWWFAVDSKPPTILLPYLKPVAESTIDDDTPIIIAAYIDRSGVNTTSVILKVDGLDVTASTLVTANAVTYKTTTPLREGSHVVYLEVGDIHGKAIGFYWSFNVEIGTDMVSEGMTNEELFQWSIVGVEFIVLFLLILLIASWKIEPKKP